jgi:hypothetical protein
MERQFTYSGNLKRVAVVAIVGFAAALFYKPDAGAPQGCDLLKGAGWVVLEIFRPAVLFGWQTVQVYLTENSGCLQHLPQIVASVGPLLCAVVG